jgi:S-methylmethionine-dependent homocysteine/selenocysteine methylase
LADINYKAIALLHTLREEYENATIPMPISGCIGPRGDGYNPTAIMSEAEAESYHRPQIETFLKADADLVTAMTINYVEEAIGIVRAAQATAMPVVISFTVETDGKLPTGQTLPQAIAQVDSATDKGPVYYMVNCAHPTHLAGALKQDWALLERIRGLRANSSCKSHAELNESTTLDEGNPKELGEQYRKLKSSLKNLNVLGGCCGTDYRHGEAICRSCLAA